MAFSFSAFARCASFSTASRNLDLASFCLSTSSGAMGVSGLESSADSPSEMIGSTALPWRGANFERVRLVVEKGRVLEDVGEVRGRRRMAFVADSAERKLRKR